MKKFLITVIIIPFLCFSQKQGNIWYFGNHVGLDFSSGSPIILTNGATAASNTMSCAAEGTAVISDSTGSVLFYTNGQQVWNRNNQIMPHGDSLFGNNSSTQAALIVPLPSSSRFFYVFTVDDFCNDALKYGFRYSKVDICMDNGLGDVITGGVEITNEKNILLLDTVAEKLTGVRHANGTDYWIIVHKYFSDAFYSYHLSATGIVDTVISHIGSVHPTGVGVAASIGELKASPNGKKLAIVNGQDVTDIAEYFDFDNNTGVVSNCISIQTNPAYSYYGVSFSPDNSKLYLTCWLNNIGVYQFNLNAGSGNADSVKASKTQISSVGCWGMQLAVNGKIYLARGGNPTNYLSVINNPNNAGVNCNYKDSAIYLNGNSGDEGLPNFIDSYSYSNTVYNCETTDIHEHLVKNYFFTIYPNPSNGSSVNINFQAPTNTDAQLIIYDIMGRTVYTNYLNRKEINSTSCLDVSSIESGVYMVNLIIDNVKVCQKLIKN